MVVVVSGLLSVALSGAAGAGSDGTSPTEPALRAELLEMARADQQERTGEGLPPGTRLPPSQDYTRSVRLREIIGEHGWPNVAQVGVDGASAAWLVAQHADFDVRFQRLAVVLMRPLVAAELADPTELAYLEDRVAVNVGEPQRYGSQVRCRDGVPQPATPLAEPERVDDLRLGVGMDTLTAYHAELAMMCESEAVPITSP